MEIMYSICTTLSLNFWQWLALDYLNWFGSLSCWAHCSCLEWEVTSKED